MRVAIAGGTGLIGGLVADRLADAGHRPLVLARSRGVDLISGAGLDVSLRDVDVVIDTSNTTETERAQTEAFFGTASQNLLAAEQRAGVRHHVLLTIAGVDRVESNAHYAGKRRQEQVVQTGPIPFTMLPATQFYEFAELVLGWMTQDGRATIAPLLVQPCAAADVANVLVELATGEPQGRTRDLAGPDPHDLVDMTRRIIDARGRNIVLVPSWRNGPFGTDMAGEALLPAEDARVAPTTFEEWLDRSTV